MPLKVRTTKLPGNPAIIKPCWTCKNLLPGDLIALDNILADPLCWPKTVWKDMAPPEGGLPIKFRRYGAMQMGREFLLSRGYPYPPNNVGTMRLYRHWKNHVPLLPVDVDALLTSGLIAPNKWNPVHALTQPTPEAIDPLAYISLYNKGIAAGIKALGLLSEKVEAFIARGEEVPTPLIKLMMDAGLKLAASQAAIKAAGKPFGDAADEDDAFRGGGDVSPRFGSNRVRLIEGEQRPVFDEGRADREHYNEQAAQEGMPRIGGY
jgi:hypothetical protein